MKKFLSITAAAVLVATSGVPPMITASADAHASTRYHTHRLKGRTHYARKYCRRSAGTTGLVAGGVGGAVGGLKVLGGGILGAAGGGAGGAGGGRAGGRTITEKQRCYWR